MERDNILLITIFIIILLLFVYFFFRKHKEEQVKLLLDNIAIQKKILDEKDRKDKQDNQDIKVTKDEISEKCKINKDLSGGECQKTKVDSCPMGCYKQCTNNNKQVVNNCDCHNRNSLLCNKNEKLSQKCLKANDMLHHKLLENEKIKGKDTNLRINNYTAKISSNKKCACKQQFKSLRLQETKIREVPQILANKA